MKRRVTIPRAAMALAVATSAAAVVGANGAPPSSFVGDGYESSVRTLDSYPDEEVSIFSTTKRWRGVDVFVTPNSLVGGDIVLTVRVYALIGNSRTLVSSGRLRPPTDNGSPPTAWGLSPSRWVAAARCGASQFLVTLQALSVTGIPAGSSLTVASYASNDLIEPPPDLGGMWFQSQGQPPAPVAGDPVVASSLVLCPDAEFLQFAAVRGTSVAANLFVHLYDESALPVIGISEPKIVWPLTTGPSGGVQAQGLRYRQQADVLALALSDSAGNYGAAALAGSSLSVLIR